MRTIKNNIRCLIRLFQLFPQFLIGIIESALLRHKYGAHWHHTDIGSEAIQQWMQKICRIIGLNIKITGELLQPSASLIVANHVSWLDIVALSSTVKSSFISKSELKKWPIIGSLAGGSGTIFIDRTSRRELGVAIDSISKVIKKGKSVILFPEGTTTNGSTVNRFKSSLFQSAIKSNCTIQPITIRYIRNNQTDTIAPYIDDNNFFIHLLRILRQANTTVRLHINKEIIPNNDNRQNLTFQSHTKIKLALNCASRTTLYEH